MCPVSLVMQWVGEIKSKCPDLSVAAFHGPSRQRDPDLLRQYDVVVTSYTICSSEETRTRNISRPCDDRNPLTTLEWFRVVLDESHTLKSHTRIFESLIKLRTTRRWCLTGTPIVGHLDNMMWQARFLGLPIGSPHNEVTAGVFERLHTSNRTFMRFSPMSRGWKLAYLAQVSMMRHHKDQRLGGFPILVIPQLHEETVLVSLSSEERQNYEERRRVCRERVRALPTLAARRELDVLMRFASTGTGEVRSSMSGGGDSSETVLVVDQEEMERIRQDDNCSICLCIFDRLSRTSCNHHFCTDCIVTVLANTPSWRAPRCPLCRSDPRPLLRIEGPPTEVAVEQEPNRRFSKLDKLVTHLEQIRAEDSHAKILVFTQFGGSQEAIAKELGDASIVFSTISGSMTPKQRDRALATFSTDESCSVFLLSVRSAGAGINISAANHIIIYDVCPNDALEKQVIGRAWRMGQSRTVHVHRYVSADTIEQRLVELRGMRIDTHGHRRLNETSIHHLLS